MSVSGPGFPAPFRTRDELIQEAQYLYGCPHKDQYLLRDPKSLPRYGHLARAVLMHYAAEHYNPHTVPMAVEHHIRELIKDMIEYKLIHRTKGYDWEWIDHFFRKVVNVYFDLDLPFDLQRIKQGFAPGHAATLSMDYDRPN